jgi:hypothetical protein
MLIGYSLEASGSSSSHGFLTQYSRLNLYSENFRRVVSSRGLSSVSRRAE